MPEPRRTRIHGARGYAGAARVGGIAQLHQEFKARHAARGGARGRQGAFCLYHLATRMSVDECQTIVVAITIAAR